MTGNARRLTLGKIVATEGALASVPMLDMLAALERHESADWGELSEEDRLANEEALVRGERVLSVYLAGNRTTFWIITERDRSATTVLLPDDY